MGEPVKIDLEACAAVLKMLSEGASDNAVMACSECRDEHVRTDCPVCQGSGLMRWRRE